jgi:hypothetical protein
MPEKSAYPEGGLDFLDYMFRKWPCVSSEEVAAVIEHARSGASVEIRKVEVIFDRRGNPGRWSRYEALHVKLLSLSAEGQDFRLSGMGVYEQEDWSCTIQGDHEKKAKGAVAINIRLRLIATPSPDFELVEDASTGEYANRIQLVKVLTNLIKVLGEEKAGKAESK